MIKAFLRSQWFFPNWLGVFTNPFYFARRGLADAMILYSPSLTGDLLDIGCGSKPYQSLFSVDSYTGLEIDSLLSRSSGKADYFYDGKHFPFSSSSFDSILCNQVLEHVFNPEDFLSEINRVMKRGATMILTAPFVWDEHEQPYDYARYSTFGLLSILQKHNFIVLEHKKLGADSTVIFQLVNAYLFKISKNFNKYILFLFTFFVIGLVNILGLVFIPLLPRNPDLFLDHIVLVKKP